MSNNTKHYAIRGGVEGRERLRTLARTLHVTTAALFDRLGFAEGLQCLDVGCGGGDVTQELAKRVGPTGKVVGVDIDQTKLELARDEAAQAGIANVKFRALDIRTENLDAHFDLVYARFLLTHLLAPEQIVTALFNHLRPGGLVVIEDIDFSGHFSWPESQTFRRYHDLYCAVVQKRGGDPNIGRRLPLLLAEGGFETIGVHLVQPMGLQGEVKLISPMTMENIAESVLQDGLASAQEIESIVRELYEFAANPKTLAGLPRIVQTWGYRPK